MEIWKNNGEGGWSKEDYAPYPKPETPLSQVIIDLYFSEKNDKKAFFLVFTLEEEKAIREHLAVALATFAPYAEGNEFLEIDFLKCVVLNWRFTNLKMNVFPSYVWVNGSPEETRLSFWFNHQV